MEYNRDLNDYGTTGEGPGDTYVIKYARPDDLATAGIDETSWDNVSVGNMSATNKGEMDCLMCHLDGSNAGSAWLKTLDCGPSNPIGPMVDPTCTGTSAYGPTFRTVDTGDGVINYDMYNRNFALKQRRMDLQASMGAGAAGTFGPTLAEPLAALTDLTGVDWGTSALSTGGAVLADFVCVSGTDAYNDGGGCYDYSYAAFTGGACAGQFATPYVINAGGGTPAPCLKLDSTQLATTPKSENCSVCHARDDNTMGLPGMMAMKTGYGNYGLIHDPSNPMPSGNMGAASDLDTDNGVGAVNDDYWFDFGCKTGMGKRAHKITAENDPYGTNARYGMSMFLPSTLDMDPGTVPNAGDPVPGKMPDIDVHDQNGMECATCHYAVGSLDNPETIGVDEAFLGYEDIPAGESHGYFYPAETIYAMDHQFAQADSFPDTKGKNNLDAKIRCDGCHTVRDNPRLTDNGGSLVAPTPLHNGLPQLHIDKIGCVTCHVPETYSAPGRLKYRDWTAGFARGTFRNQLDWNFNLVEGNHNTVPMLRKWATKNGETKIYPALPSLLPTWYEMIPNSGVLVADDAGMVAAGEPLDNIYDVFTGVCSNDDTLSCTVATVDADCGGTGNACNATTFYPSPVKNRDLQRVGEYVRDNNPQFDMRLNGGNTVPLFDGFQIVDSWEIDKTEEIDAMMAAFDAGANGSDARFVSFMNVVQADFDVTHGVVPKEWALGGSERGGCVSCHSSRAASLDGMNPNPNYSEHSIGFFEGYTQPIDNAGMPGFGVGGQDMVKNWMAMFADFDAAMMCGMGDPTLMRNMEDTLTPMIIGLFGAGAEVTMVPMMLNMMGITDDVANHHNYYFNPMTGEPAMTAECSPMSWFSNNPMFGTTGVNAQLQHAVGMMATTFDQAMGFPSGTAMQMGMYDGVAGIQGFALKELQKAGAGGCNGFAGPVSFSPMAGQSVNNCMPNFADATVAPAIDGAFGAGSAMSFAMMINGTCSDTVVGDADPNTGVGIGGCIGGFRNNGPCDSTIDCEGAMTDTAEIFHNPLGLIMGRAEAQSHFKIDLQQSYKTAGDPTSAKVKWSAGGDQNPSNPSHMNKWDQAQFCYDYMNGPNPMTPAVDACMNIQAVYDANLAAGGMCSGNPAGAPPASGAMDCRLHIATAMNMNQFLGYTPGVLAILMNPGVAQGQAEYNANAQLSVLSSDDTDLFVSLNASRSTCSQLINGVYTAWTPGCSYTFNDVTADGGAVEGVTVDVDTGLAVYPANTERVVSYPAAGDYVASVTVCLNDDATTGADESAICDTTTVTATAMIVEDATIADPGIMGIVNGNETTLTAATLHADAASVRIYWGDRTSTTVSDMADLGTTAGVAHTYNSSGTRTIRVKVLVQADLDGDSNLDRVEDNYTLTVTIP